MGTCKAGEVWEAIAKVRVSIGGGGGGGDPCFALENITEELGLRDDSGRKEKPERVGGEERAGSGGVGKTIGELAGAAAAAGTTEASVVNGGVVGADA